MKKTRTAALIGTAFLGSVLTLSAFADGHDHDHHDHKHAEHKHEKHDHDHEGHEHHGKHEHGVADMDIALDGNTLLVQLKSPMANFLSFEHEPSTNAQKKAYAKLVKALNKPKKLIDLDGGKCKLADKDVDLPYGDGGHDDHDHAHGHHDHDEHKHEANHDHGHDEHEHHAEHKGHDHEEHKGAAHSDIEFKYVYTCKKPKRLEHIDVQLFKQFKGFEKINVQWLANNKQGHATLTPKSTEVELHEHHH